MKVFFISLSLLCLVAWTGLADASVRPVELRCEYLRDPLGIDTPQPRLSWQFEVTQPRARGQRQTAYQVLVASAAAHLTAGRADLWDSGRVESDQSIHVRYAGRPLASGQACFWKVRVWDERGQASAWSAPGFWSMGLLQPADWHGVWIGRDETEVPGGLTGTSWIWFPEGSPAVAAPVGTRFFRRRVPIPEKSRVEAARLLVAADNEFELFVNGTRLGSGASFKVAVEFDLTDRLKIGDNVLAIAVKNAGETDNPAGLLARLELTVSPGGRTVIATDEEWRASRIGVTGWERTEFNAGGWVPARVLGPVGMAPWGEVTGPEDRRLPARQLRREFNLEKPVRRATAYMSGLGLSELYLNGRKVGDHVLSPGLTDYPTRVFYVTYDVTRALRRGRNCVGVWLGNGRYFAPRLRVPTETRTYGFPKLLFHLRVEHTDGTTAEVVSDDSWRLTTEGPIRANNEYDGEEYDARKEMAGWAEAGFDDAGWARARVVSPPGGRLAAQMMPPIRVVETLRPVSFREIAPGTWIYDFGQNLVGWCRLKVRGKAGTVVTLRHAETLRPDGMLYLDNLRGARVTDTYTLAGKGAEVYEPRFTYHGFRYVELRGFPGQPGAETLTACVVNDDLERAGEWSSSHPLLNRLYQNIYWGVRGNYRSLPTDCPQRDERQGWLGDRSEESKGEAFLFNTAPLYAKWVQDFADAQKDSGSVPDVCPPYWPLYSDNVTWPSSTVIIPGHLLTQFGDRAVIERHYPSMKRWVEFMAGFIRDDLMPRDTYGDWCVPPEDPKLIHSQDPTRKTHGTILGTTYFAHCLGLLAGYAEQLGKPDDARRYRELAGRLKTGLNAKFYDAAKGYYDNGSQTSCILPLAMNLAPEGQQQRLFAHLVGKITGETQNHIGTGLIGGQWLMRTLSAHGRADLAYTLATNRTYPSWGYMIEKGATTIWELWNGDTADPAMNSGNHVMLVGDLLIWMYENLAGIQADPARPGFKHILMRPTPVGDLTHVRATHRSPHGLIASQWRIEREPVSHAAHRLEETGVMDTVLRFSRFDWEVTVPPNTTATLLVPYGPLKTITEGGKPAATTTGLKYWGTDPRGAIFEAAPGRYAIISR